MDPELKSKPYSKLFEEKPKSDVGFVHGFIIGIVIGLIIATAIAL